MDIRTLTAKKANFAPLQHPVPQANSNEFLFAATGFCTIIEFWCGLLVRRTPLIAKAAYFMTTTVSCCKSTSHIKWTGDDRIGGDS